MLNQLLDISYSLEVHPAYMRIKQQLDLRILKEERRKKNMKKIASMLIIALMVLMMAMPAAVHATGTTLTVVATAEAHYTRTFAWTIAKSVTPEAWFLFKGDSGTSQYTVTVTKDAGTDAYFIDGIITVTNGGAEDTENLAIQVELKDGVSPPNDLIQIFPVDLGSNTVIPAGQTYTYAYSVTIPDIPTFPGSPPYLGTIHPGGTYKITADVTITNHAPGDTTHTTTSSPTCILPSNPTLIHDTINVDDTNGYSWSFSASGSQSYEMTFESADEDYVHMNTATIRETGQSATASVKVYSYELEVSKDAQTYFTRTYTWTILKTGDQTYLELTTGDTADVHYTITVDATYEDSDWGVKEIDGIIVHNPAPIPATINSITDMVSPDIAGDVDFEVTFPYTLAAGDTLIGTYKADVPDATSRTNTATVTLQNYDYDYLGNPTADGTTDFTGTAAVDFSNAHINKVDESITVSDTYIGGPQGVIVAYGDLPKTFTYTRTIGPYTPGIYTVVNTASFVTSDTGTTDSSSWKVDVSVTGAATISGVKFYDTNLNGQQDGSEPGIPGWKIELYQNGVLVGTTFTGSSGDYIFENLAPAQYTVVEVFPSSPLYIATTPTFAIVDASAGGEYTAAFGNVCLMSGKGGLTLGFWSNKNGQALITSGDILFLNTLPLYHYRTWPPFGIKTDIKTYLLSATATDMKFMLSAQLIATELDVNHGFLGAGTEVYVDSSHGFMTIGYIMTQAINAFSGTRATQEYWKNVLDGINNNRLPFLSPTPIPPVY
jgi:hypothetical protein